MNKHHVFLATALLCLACIASAQERSAVLLNPDDRGIGIELFTAEPVSAFDVSVQVENVSSMIIDNCVSGLPSTHMGNCIINDENVLKIIVFSPSNATLQSSHVGTIRLGDAKLRHSTINAFAPDGSPRQIEFLGLHQQGGGEGKFREGLLSNR